MKKLVISFSLLSFALSAFCADTANAFVHTFLISGPYPNALDADDRRLGYSTDFLGGEADAVPREGQKAKGVFEADIGRLIAEIGGKNEWGFTKTQTFDATWRKMAFDRDKIPCDALFPPIRDFFVLYAAVYLDVERPVDVTLALGADDHYRLWLDRTELGGVETSQPVRPRQFRHTVALAPGVHRVLLKVVEKTNDSGFCLEVLDADGNFPSGVTVSAEPPVGKPLVVEQEVAASRTPEKLKAKTAAAQTRLARAAAERPALEAALAKAEADERLARQDYSNAIAVVERRLADERAEALKSAQPGVDKPLEPFAARRRLCLNGAWDGGIVPSDMRKKETVVSRTIDWDGSAPLDFLCEGLVGDCAVSVNGKPVGDLSGITGLYRLPLAGLSVGTNTLTLTVRRSPLLPTRDYWARGLLGDVFVEYRPEVFVADVYAKPSWRKACLDTTAEIRNASPADVRVEVRTRVVEGGRVRLELPAQTAVLKPGEVRETASSAGWADPKLWGPSRPWGTPALYALVTDVWAEGRQVDRHVETFGFREFWIVGTQFFLNGRRFRMQADTGVSIHDPHETEIFCDLLRRDGIDSFRMHDNDWWSVTVPAVADRLGMGVIAQMYPKLNDPKDGKHTVERHSSAEDFLAGGVQRWNEANYVRWYRALRNRPSVLLWSTDNEVMAQSKDTAERAPLSVRDDRVAAACGKFVKALDPSLVMTRDGDCGTWGRRARWHEEPPCDTANFHYPDFYPATRLEDWMRVYDWRPLVYGETLYHAYGAWDAYVGALPVKVFEKARRVRDFVGRYNEWEIPAMVFMGLAHDGFVTLTEDGSGNVFGLGGRTGNVRKDKTMLPIPWPALSGRGKRKPAYRARPGFSGNAAINWIDPSRPTHLRNAVNDAYRDTLAPRDPLCLGTDAEAIVRTVPGGTVWARREATGETVGVVADAEGRAWFRLLEPGRWTFSAGGKEASRDLSPRGAERALKPGFAGIDEIEITKGK